MGVVVAADKNPVPRHIGEPRLQVEETECNIT